MKTFGRAVFEIVRSKEGRWVKNMELRKGKQSLPKRMSKNDIKSDTIGAGCVQLVGKHAQCLFFLDIKKQSSALAVANRLAAE